MAELRSDHYTATHLDVAGKKYIVHKKFESKKNDVFLVTREKDESQLYIIKHFSTEFSGNYQIEQQALQRLDELNIAVPKILGSDDDVLLLEFLPGLTIMDIINESIDKDKMEFMESKIKTLSRIFSHLGNWFAELHARTLDQVGNVQLKGDCILKNFIYNDNSSSKSIAAVDFEESIIGPPLLDLGSLTAAILTIKPIFSHEDFNFLDQFLIAYNARINELVKKDISIDINSLDLVKHASQALICVSKWHSDKSAKELVAWAEKFKEDRTISKN